MFTATRTRAMALLSLFLLAMFLPLPSPVRVGGVTVAGPDAVCAQQIECFDDNGNHIPCPPEPPHTNPPRPPVEPPDPCHWSAVGGWCITCFGPHEWNPFRRAFACAMCAWEIGQCLRALSD